MALLEPGVEGWLTEGQARRVATAAARVPPQGRVVEIGSFRGRSTIVLARSAPAGAELVAIDPHLGSDRGPQEYAERRDVGEDDVRAFRSNLERAGVAARVRHVRARSAEATGAVEGPIDLLYVDGAHRYGPALDDLRRWGARVAPGGTLLVHDAFSSIGVTLALLRHTAASTAWRYAGRERSLAEFRREPVRGAERARNLGRQLAQLPWFAGNVVLKALIAARVLRRPWPY